MQSTNQRNQFLDYTKGILMFLVVYGHTIQYVAYNGKEFFQDQIFKAIYMFHMPLFMAISGFLSFYSIQKTTFFEITKKRFFNLIIPIVSWSIIYTTAFYLAKKEYSVNNFFQHLLNNIISNLWFLWALFGAIVTIALIKRFKHDGLYGIVLSFCVVIMIPDKGNIPLFKYTFPFFCIGYFLAQQKEYLELEAVKRSKLLLAAAIFFTILCYLLWSTETYIYVSGMTNFRSSILRYFSGFVASIVIMRLIWELYNFSSTFFRWFICEIGKGSLYIYILQTYFFTFASKFQYPFHHNFLFLLFIYPMSALLLSFCLLQVGKISERNVLVSKFLFGRISSGNHSINQPNSNSYNTVK
ncbi:MAG: acyltransferase family protein [Nostoc sp. CmiVER01]|uniref:acyltransferase family protein n=1 Tax=Nostoc sp. CmiVER01 TaxID=3075384 RepID=UPI002AD22047|nr:acyltransferase family protein [Nostoc sp. CmiVER01]MDZ8127026.1 acyltransferase family protein [Nostoc sp. CmiVER01]